MENGLGSSVVGTAARGNSVGGTRVQLLDCSTTLETSNGTQRESQRNNFPAGKGMESAAQHGRTPRLPHTGHAIAHTPSLPDRFPIGKVAWT